MSPHPKYFLKYLNLEILVYSRDQAYLINPEKWDKLSKETKFDNPFFNRTWLLLALDHFKKSDNVYVVTIRKSENIVCLFPIEINNFIGLNYLNIWQHKHCFANTPLVNINLNFEAIISKLCILLNCLWGRIHLHHPDLMPSISSKKGYQCKYQRAYIKNTSEIRRIPRVGKFNRENRRLIKNASNDLDINFFEYADINAGLKDYLKIEHNGWKGIKKGSILSSDSTKAFYIDLLKSDYGKKSISIFGLNSNEGVIACAIRVTSNTSIFEIKTTYNQDYSQYAPGRILEIFLLKNLENFKQYKVDSCTSPDNTLINRLWGQQTPLITTTIFSTSFLGCIIKNIYFIKQLTFR